MLHPLGENAKSEGFHAPHGVFTALTAGHDACEFHNLRQPPTVVLALCLYGKPNLLRRVPQG